MKTLACVGIGPRSKCPQAQLRLDELSKRMPLQLSGGRQAVPGADEAYTYGSWRGIFDCLRPRRDVVDAVDADEAIAVGCLGGRVGKL